MSEFGTGSVKIERTFAAPVDVVWKMWSSAEDFASWYGPMGATIPVANMDLRVGGRRHLCMAMETPNGPMQMWFVGEFVEIVENQRLVYTDSMSNEDGDVVIPDGMPEGAPTSTQVVVDLDAVDGGTRMVMEHVGVPADSPGGMGWNMAIDKLAERLAA